MKVKTLFVSIVFILLMSMVITGCQPSTSAPSPTTGTIKIGHIRPLTGALSVVGDRMVKAAQFGFEEVNYEVAGKKIEVIVEDSAGLSEVAIDKARKLVEHDKVALILGPTIGGPQMAVSDYCNTKGVINIHTNPSPPAIIMKDHKWTFQVGGAEPQLPSCMARYAYEHLGVKSVTGISLDNEPGHGFLGAFIDSFQRLGGQAIQEQYAPMGTPDYAPYFAAIKDADACAAWFDGYDAINFLTQYEEFGMWNRMPIVPVFHGAFFAPFLVDRLSEKARAPVLGKVVPTPYSSLLDTPINKKFVEEFQKRWELLPDDSITQTYGGVLLALAALEATGGDTTPDKLRQAILDQQIIGPDGPIRFDKEKQSVIRNIYIAKLEKPDKEQETIWVPVFTYEDVPPLGF